MINKNLIIGFVTFLSNGHSDETWFNAIQGDFEDYVQKKFAYYLSTILTNNPTITIEKKVGNRIIDLQIVQSQNTFNIEFKSVHNDVSRTFLHSYKSGMGQVNTLPKNNNNFLIITATHFNNTLKNPPSHGIFNRGKVIKSKNGLLFSQRQLNAWNNLNSTSPLSVACFSFKQITVEFYLFP
jgi:hypothetical protein